jgi:predicted ester cyclase
MSEEHKVLAMRMYNEVIGQGNLAALDDIVHDDFIEHEEMPGLPTDKTAPAAFVSMFRSAFPDLHASIEGMVQEGEKLVVRARMFRPPATSSTFEQ